MQVMYFILILFNDYITDYIAAEESLLVMESYTLYRSLSVYGVLILRNLNFK